MIKYFYYAGLCLCPTIIVHAGMDIVDFFEHSSCINSAIETKNLLSKKVFDTIPIANTNGLYEYYTDRFEDYARLEKAAYDLLKQRPLSAAVTYLAVPWQTIFEWQYLGSDAYKALAHTMLEDIKHIALQRPGFTIMCNFNPFFLSIAKTLSLLGIKTLFTPGVIVGQRLVEGIAIEPFPYFACNTLPGAPVKDIFFSFVGTMTTHPIRQAIAGFAGLPDVFIKNLQWTSHVGTDVTKENELLFGNVLARSRFSLCPRGYQPNSIRLYESLAAGAIPVLITNSAVLPSLPAGVFWDSCIIRVAEQDIAKIPAILQSIDVQQENEMRQSAVRAYQSFSGENLVRVIREYYGEGG